MQLTLERGASVAEVARAHGVNANQVFKWRRAFERGELVEACSALLPVSISHPTERAPEAGTEAPQVQEASSGAIHIDDQHRERCRRGAGALDSGELQPVIDFPAGTRIWIAAGVTDMRRGFQGLSAQVQTVLEQQPYSGHVFIFRGRRGDIIKCLWFDGDGLCLFAKRLEKGRFVWPKTETGTVSLSRAQLSMLLEGIDWRRVERTWTPEVAV